MGSYSVYYSMTNGGIIEGHTKYSGCSDLNLAIGCAGRWIDISSPVLLRINKWLDGSGVTSWAASLRKPAIEKEARLRPQHFTLGVDVKQKQQTSWGVQAVMGRPLP